jgi:prepilin-type processing-associated H-X9-DG protein
VNFRWQNDGQSGGFSLLELLITLTILIILTTLMWSRSSWNYQRTQKQLCQDNLQKCYVSLQIFANDHAGSLPEFPGAKISEEVLAQLVPRYSADTTIFICPGSKDAPLPSGEPFEKRKISYAYYMGARLTDARTALMSDRQVDTGAKTNGQQLFSATGKGPGSNHHKYGGNVLFADGRAESSPAKSAFTLALTNGVVLLNPKP